MASLAFVRDYVAILAKTVTSYFRNLFKTFHGSATMSPIFFKMKITQIALEISVISKTLLQRTI